MKASNTIIPIAFLIWNLIGVAALGTQWNMDLDELAMQDPYQAEMFAQMPTWAWAAYAIAVSSGFIGALLLVFGKKLCIAFFLLSLTAVLVQFGYAFLMTDLLAVKGVMAAAFPAVIIVLAIVQYLYARNKAATLQ